MRFEWDPAKDAANRAKHGIAFEDAIEIFAGRTLEQEDSRRDYGETRVVAIGRIRGYPIVVVYTPRGEARRIISARLAHRREREAYGKGEEGE